MKKIILLGILAMGLLPFTVSARGRVGVFFGGPGFAPYGYGYYNPYWYGPYGWGPEYSVPASGQVKFDTKAKDALVYIDGAYAGSVGDLKTFRLRPGSYNIELRGPGRTPFKQQIYVVAGKTTKLHPPS